MKQIISILLALTLIFALAAPCAAAQIEPRTISSQYVYDNIGNRFKVTGHTELSGYSAVGYTSFSITNYGGGDSASIVGVTETVGLDGTVYFSDGTTPNYSAMDGFSSYSGKTSGTVERAKSFTAIPSNYLCTHSFTTSSGASLSFSTGALGS